MWLWSKCCKRDSSPGHLLHCHSLTSKHRALQRVYYVSLMKSKFSFVFGTYHILFQRFTPSRQDIPGSGFCVLTPIDTLKSEIVLNQWLESGIISNHSGCRIHWIFKLCACESIFKLFWLVHISCLFHQGELISNIHHAQ